MLTIKVMSLISLHPGALPRNRRAPAPIESASLETVRGKTNVSTGGSGGTASGNWLIFRVFEWGMVVLLMTLMLPHSAARASEVVAVTLVAEVRNEVELAGRKSARLMPATVLQQGQEVFYTVRILNPSAAAVRDVVVVQRIPQNTTYVPNSVGGPGAEITFSADGGQSFAKEGQVSITEQTVPLASPGRVAQGRTDTARPAMPQDYTHIRWRLRNSLAPGAVALARFRAVFR